MLKANGKGRAGKKKENEGAEKFQEANMLKLLLVSPNRDALSDLASVLAEYDDVDFSWAESGEATLDMVSGGGIDLVVTDERLGDMTGLEFASRLLTVDPRINCASVSRLSPDDFHEASEGLGLMAQLPIQPGREDAEGLLQRLRKIKGLTGGG